MRSERGRARLRRVGATCAGATTVKRPPWTIPSRDYATISLRGTVQRCRLCLAFHSWFANTRVSRRRSVIGMIGCSAADRGLYAHKGGGCTVLLELQAKHVTPFAVTRLPSYWKAISWACTCSRTHRQSEKARRSSSFRLGMDIHTRQPLPTHDETAGQTSLGDPYCVTPAKPLRQSVGTFPMRLDRFPCMSFVCALAELSTTRSAMP
jgi:hypothetical protein